MPKRTLSRGERVRFGIPPGGPYSWSQNRLLPALNQKHHWSFNSLGPCCPCCRTSTVMSSLGSGSGSRSEEPQIDPSEDLDMRLEDDLDMRLEEELDMRLEEVQLGDLKDGDQIAVRGNVEDLSSWLLPFTAHTGGSYLHHGIFVKENLSVIEFHGENKADARPKIRPILQFCYGHHKLYRVRYKDGECFSVEETMRRAKEAVEKGNVWPVYNLITNNCESFATLLKTGKAVSWQVLESMVTSISNPTMMVLAATASSVRGAAGSLESRKKET